MWSEIDDFLDEAGGTGTVFTRNDVAEALGIEPEEATVMLQEHCNAQKHVHKLPRYVLACEGRGSAATWYAAAAKDHRRIEQNAMRVAGRAIKSEIIRRIRPVVRDSARQRSMAEATIAGIEASIGNLFIALRMEADAEAFHRELEASSNGAS